MSDNIVPEEKISLEDLVEQAFQIVTTECAGAREVAGFRDTMVKAGVALKEDAVVFVAGFNVVVNDAESAEAVLKAIPKSSIFARVTIPEHYLDVHVIRAFGHPLVESNNQESI